MNSFKKLAGDTAIYGMSSIIGRFLNWWLVPYYSHIFVTSEYGIVTNLYSYMAFLVVILTFGLETGFFRFASKETDKQKVFSNTISVLLLTTGSFILVVFTFSNTLSGWMDYEKYPEYIRWIALIVGIDVLTSIPFAKLRIESKAIKFVVLKMVSIFTTIFFNIFFLSICPALIKANPESWVLHIYSPEVQVGYVFISNLIASGLVFILLLPEMRIKFQLSKRLLKEIIWYSFPILIVGIAGMINQHIDKILMPKLLAENQDPMGQLGIYGVNYKLAVLMNMFIQAFRYAFEPFFFSQKKSEGNKESYAVILNYFVIFGLIIFLGISLFLYLFKSLKIIDEAYYSGLKIVPIVLMANLFLGIYYTLSLWYKLTDKTRYGAYFALIGAIISLIVNVAFIPHFGYMASAVAVLICFITMTVLSYYFGQKYYYVPYKLGRMVSYLITALVIYLVSIILNLEMALLKYLVHLMLMVIFIGIIFFSERKDFLKVIKS